jgi:hypothetical protein
MRDKRLIFTLIILFTSSLALTACATEPDVALAGEKLQSVQSEVINNTGVEPEDAASANAVTDQENQKLDNWVEDVPRSDEQGAVSVLITPINLNQSWETIDFRVKMDTHSVDLGMDLAELATLTTDNGHTVKAIKWDGASGGHHVSGILSFPASADGLHLLNSVSKMTLTLIDVDAPERVFIWER